MNTLALVESPVQLLHVLEWCYATGAAPRTRIAVLAPRDEVGRAQLRSMLAFADEEEIETTWHDPRRDAFSLAQAVAGFAGVLSRTHRLVVGDPFSGLIQAMLRFAKASEVVVVDDGTATLEFTSQLGQDLPLTRWDARGTGWSNRLRAPFGRAARRFFTPSVHRSVTLFTVMPVGAARGVVVRPNRYDWTRGRFPSPEVHRGTDIIGTSLVESGVVEPDAYLRAVELLASGPNRGKYYAHRREDDAKLRRVAERTGLTVVRPDVPLEVELRRGPVAQQVISFPSSVAYTLPMVLRSVASRVTVVDVDPSWIRQDVGQNARGFLSSMTVQARRQSRAPAA